MKSLRVATCQNSIESEIKHNRKEVLRLMRQQSTEAGRARRPTPLTGMN